jgi:hypothetical protein
VVVACAGVVAACTGVVAACRGVVAVGTGLVVAGIGVVLVGVVCAGGGTGFLVTGRVRVTGALVVGAVVGREVLVEATGFF